jgi:hypothetical protein
MRILNQLESWYHSLPDHLAFTDLNLYIHKDEGTLAAFFFLHLTYHSCVSDLTRITLPGYSFPASAAFQHAPDDVKVQHQNTCFLHADRVSHLLKKGLDMNGSALDDYFASTAAFESTKIQVIYVATLCRNASDLLHTVTRNVRVNLDVLVAQHWTSEGPNFFVSCPYCAHAVNLLSENIMTDCRSSLLSVRFSRSLDFMTLQQDGQDSGLKSYSRRFRYHPINHWRKIQLSRFLDPRISTISTKLRHFALLGRKFMHQMFDLHHLILSTRMISYWTRETLGLLSLLRLRYRQWTRRGSRVLAQ